MTARAVVGTVVGVLTASVPAMAAPAPFTADPIPGFTVDTYVLVVNTGSLQTRHVVGRYQRYATTSTSALGGRVVSRDRQRIIGASRRSAGSIVRDPYIAEPDSTVTTPEDVGLRLARFAVTEARSGRLTLVATRLGGRDALRATIPLAANACQKLDAGGATLWLTRSTLLPKRVDVTRGNTTTVSNYTYASFNQAIPKTVGPSPTVGRGAPTVNERFLRRNPAAAAARLPFVPRLPTRLPSGFTLSQSGWAPYGARTGRRLANKADRWLFSAVYRRGWERIEITERVATRTWRTDPFQRTCQILRGGRTSVGSLGARYGVGPDITSHIWYRDGNRLVTVSGPYGKNDLKTIAASLTKIT